MRDRHISDHLAAHIDGELAPRKAQEAESHLRRCADCQAEREQVRIGMAVLAHLPAVEAPEAIWTSLEAALLERRARNMWSTLPWRMAFAAAVTLALAGAAYWRTSHRPGTSWEVMPAAGAPAIGAKHIRGLGQAGAGEWIETDATSRATVKVGAIGSVEIAPNTRLRIITTRSDEHRLALARGEIHARISAPPRLFFVDTASGTAVDLGCEYTLKTGEDGFGLLQVTKGWVSFEWKGLESLVPAGATCRTRPQLGPGVPYFDDASENLKQALEHDALTTILSESRVRDTLTLWHLLSRVEGADRERVYDRIAALTPVPAGVSREQALKLDPQTLKHWREELAWTW